MCNFSIFLILSFWLLSACASNLSSPGEPASLTSQKSHYYMTVSGHIEPSLASKYPVEFFATYDNPKCSIKEAIFDSQHEYTNYKLSPNIHGNYIIKIPLAYNTSSCQWPIQKIEFTVYKPFDFPMLTVANFSQHAKPLAKNTKPPVFTLKCDDTDNCTSVEPYTYDDPLPVNYNYKFEFNIEKLQE